MKNIITKIGFVTLFSMLTLTIQAQNLPETGSLGIRANLTGQGTIELPYMLNDELSLAPFIGLNSTEDQTTNFTIGVSPRYYVSTGNSIATYATGVFGISNTSFSNANNSITDFNLGIGYGAEYFFANRFSVSADANLNARFGDSATNIATVARVSASIYF